MCLVCPPTMGLDGLLVGSACKERGQQSEDFFSVVGGLQNFEFLWKDLASSVLEIDRFSMEHFLKEVGFRVITRR